jgi:hypothetical protein
MYSLFSFVVLGGWGTLTPTAYIPAARPMFGHRRPSSLLQSSIGGGGADKPSEPEGDSEWDDFFREESENLQRAREYMSENALPLNYDESSEDETDEEDDMSSSLVRQPEFFQNESNKSPEDLAKNPYLQVVSKLSPSEMIAKFTSSAHPRVQNAVRSTILSLIGGLPKMAFDTTTITTGQRLASLMFQLQVSITTKLFVYIVIAQPVP